MKCLVIIDQAMQVLHFLGDRKSLARASELLAKRAHIDTRPGGQTMLGGEDAAQRQSEAEMILSGDGPDDDRPTSIIELADGEGWQMRAQVIDRFDYQGQDYIALLDLDEDDREVIILAVEEEDDGEQYVAIEDDDALGTVFEVFKRRNEEYFDFVD